MGEAGGKVGHLKFTLSEPMGELWCVNHKPESTQAKILHAMAQGLTCHFQE